MNSWAAQHNYHEVPKEPVLRWFVLAAVLCFPSPLCSPCILSSVAEVLFLFYYFPKSRPMLPRVRRMTDSGARRTEEGGRHAADHNLQRGATLSTQHAKVHVRVPAFLGMGKRTVTFAEVRTHAC